MSFQDNMLFEQKIYSENLLSDDHFKLLKKCLEYKENEKIMYNTDLSGNIELEYKILKIDQVLVNQFEKWANEFFKENLSKNNQVKPPTIEKLTLSNLWINKQKKYEFNPLHRHGGLVSFVCWIQIPYNLEDELNFNNCKNSITKCNSLFEFSFTNYLGNIINLKLNIDKSWEGKCIFFDSKLNHQVYPFYTSDDYRISVSGNFIMEQENDKNINRIFSYK